MVGRIYDFEGEVDALLDEVEMEVLRVNESRVQICGTRIVINFATIRLTTKRVIYQPQS